ncbi:hypothetical protein ACFQH5_09440 [Halomonas salifodinae]|uniref:Uncharacterized protein n=1 Tax=Halomonas salifodinae TaxID=438745 RepID=A0ABW2F038_9GAMM
MQNQDTTTAKLVEIEAHSRRAWALTSMLMTYINQDTDEPSNEVLSEALAEIWERLDAIGAEIHRKASQG